MNKQLKLMIAGFVALVVLGSLLLALRSLGSKKTIAPPQLATPAPTVEPVAPAKPDIFTIGQGGVCKLSFKVKPTLVPGLGCVAKELYKDVSTNTAGSYAITAVNKLASGYELIPGTQYVYVINYSNTGTGSTTGVIEDVLPSGLTFVDASAGCSYATVGRKVTCTLPSVAASATGNMAIRIAVDSAIAVEGITNTAVVIPTSGTQSSCKLSNPIQQPGMACIGIAKTPTSGNAAIGDKLTFTCSGSVTPPTAGTLSYKFRYSINGGVPTALTNKTTTTAELTIAACGSYKVECQACATLNGVLTCAPNWTGATQ